MRLIPTGLATVAVITLLAIRPDANGGIQPARLPILDMHMHARTADFYGKPPLPLCAPVVRMPRWDQRKPMWQDETAPPLCAAPLMSPVTDADLRRQTLATMEQHNVIGVLGGEPTLVAEWMQSAPGRFLPGLDIRLDGDTAQPI